ncbi:MAG: Asp23/Gls24 family envelope stress response protein [Clostridia bacterium]|nr:Asp23/Gls24 family envelope stress response protein [Clostridia bacterium]
MATEESISMKTVDIQGGKITFAPDVIATIASLAANEVEGVEGMSGTMVEGITGILNKKNITKGIKVEINEDVALIDINVILKYGYKIHEVSSALQKNIKTTIENMTGLKVAAVNVFVQSIAFEKAEKTEVKPAKVETEEE